MYICIHDLHYIIIDKRYNICYNDYWEKQDMPGKFINRLRVLLAQKAETEKRNITLKEVQRETGIAWTTLQSWANNDVTRYDAPVIKNYAII